MVETSLTIKSYAHREPYIKTGHMTLVAYGDIPLLYEALDIYRVNEKYAKKLVNKFL